MPSLFPRAGAPQLGETRLQQLADPDRDSQQATEGDGGRRAGNDPSDQAGGSDHGRGCDAGAQASQQEDDGQKLR